MSIWSLAKEYFEPYRVNLEDVLELTTGQTYSSIQSAATDRLVGFVPVPILHDVKEEKVEDSAFTLNRLLSITRSQLGSQKNEPEMNGDVDKYRTLSTKNYEEEDQDEDSAFASETENVAKTRNEVGVKSRLLSFTRSALGSFVGREPEPNSPLDNIMNWMGGEENSEDTISNGHGEISKTK